jgi:hypothetical protein
LLDEDQEMTFGGLPNLARLGHNAMSELSPLSETSHTVRGAWENVHLAKTKIIEQPVRCLQPPPGMQPRRSDTVRGP